MVPEEDAIVGIFLAYMLGEEEVPHKIILLLDLSSKHTGVVMLNPMMMADNCHKVSLGSNKIMVQSLLTRDPLPYDKN